MVDIQIGRGDAMGNQTIDQPSDYESDFGKKSGTLTTPPQRMSHASSFLPIAGVPGVGVRLWVWVRVGGVWVCGCTDIPIMHYREHMYYISVFISCIKPLYI